MLSELISLARKYGCFIFSLEIFIHESTALKRRSARSRPKPGTRALIPTGNRPAIYTRVRVCKPSAEGLVSIMIEWAHQDFVFHSFQPCSLRKNVRGLNAGFGIAVVVIWNCS